MDLIERNKAKKELNKEKKIRFSCSRKNQISETKLENHKKNSSDFGWKLKLKCVKETNGKEKGKK